MRKQGIVAVVGALSVAALVAVVPRVVAQSSERSDVTLTIYGEQNNTYNPYAAAYGYGYQQPYGGYGYGGYNPYGYGWDGGGFAVVKERRSIELQKGVNDVRFEGVASRIDAGTVRFKSATDSKGTQVIEQKFRYDLSTPETLLARYVDHEVTVVTEKGEVSGTLLSYDAQQLVVQTTDPKHPIHIVRRGDNVRDIQFGALPEGLVTRPTLMWKVKAKKAGAHEAEVSYRTAGLSWNADYTIVWDEDKDQADVSAWVTIVNRSGADFDNATVKLMSGGTSQTAVNPYQYGYGSYPQYTGYDPNASSEGSYDVFSLENGIDLDHRGSKQVELLSPINGTSATNVLVHDSMPSYYPPTYPNQDMYAFNYQQRAMDASVFLEIGSNPKGKAKSKVAMPQGKARLYKRSAKGKGELELVTETQVPHSSGDTPLRLRVGGTANIEVSHSQVDFKLDERNKEMRETVEVKLRNTGKKSVEVIVREVIGWRWTDWSIESETVKGKRSGLVQEYRIKVPANKEKSFRYTALYTW
jgi:hypothetical protein